MTNVISINDHIFRQTLLKLLQTRGTPIVIKFTASWCGPCKLAAPVYHHLSEKYANTPLVFATVDIDGDENRWIVNRYDIRSVPTFIFLKPYTNGKIYSKISGFSGPEQISEEVKGYISSIYDEDYLSRKR